LASYLERVAPFETELTIPAVHTVPTAGTLPHGYFRSIELGADFYTGGVVVEPIPGQGRITNLERVIPKLYLRDDQLHVRAEIPTPCGPLIKEVVVSALGEHIILATDFPGWQRPYGTVRAGTLTLLPEAFHGPLAVETINSGNSIKRFEIDRGCQHPQPASALVSCSTGLGGAGGALWIGDRQRGLMLEWDPGIAAAFPMLYHKRCPPAAMTRIIFSLCEVVETLRECGTLPRFGYRLSPARGLECNLPSKAKSAANHE